MTASLPRPGVKVLQTFRNVTPTVITPTLLPCLVGPCKQLVDVVEDTSAGGRKMNPDALVSMPAIMTAKAATGSPPVYTGLDAKKLILSLSGGASITTTFVDTGAGLSPDAIVAKILATFAANGVTVATAEIVGTTQFRVRTVNAGAYESIEVMASTDTAVLAAFDLVIGYRYTGAANYAQEEITVPLTSFPDPANNLSQLSVEPDTVRAFLALGYGVNVRELSRTESYLRKGGGGTAATILGTTALSTGGLYGAGTLAGTTLDVTLNDGTITHIPMGSPGPLNATGLLNIINIALGGKYAVNNTGLRITSKTLGATSKVLVGGTAGVVLGISTTATVGTAGVVVADDGNGDSVSPFIDFIGYDFTAVGTAATCTGVVGVTAGCATISGKTLELAISGKPPQTMTFPVCANTAAVLVAINAFFGAGFATAPAGDLLVLTTTKTGEEGTIEVRSGTALALLGLVPNVTGSTIITAILPDFTALNSTYLRMNLGGTIVEHLFTGFTSGTTKTQVVAQINADVSFSALAVAVLTSTDHIQIYLKTGGTLAALQILPAVTGTEAAYLLGFETTGSYVFSQFIGGGFPPLAGDDLYIDGTYLGRLTQAAPGGVVTRLRIDHQVPISSNYGSLFYITAKGLVAVSATRPTPELVVASDGTPTIKGQILRDISGAYMSGSTAALYMAYRALRLDVTPSATVPRLITVGSTTEAEAVLGAPTADNPLGLAAYFALLNAPGINITVLGVDKIAADEPYGTVEAYTRAAEFLEAYPVYAICPLTHDETVAGIMRAHCIAMSDPDMRMERMCVFNFSEPTKAEDTLVASGTNGNTSGSTGLSFDTGIVSLSSLVLAKGISPIGVIPVSAGLFLDVAADAKRYSISGIVGGIITIRTSFSAGENNDLFYSTTALTVPLIEESFVLRIRGASLVLPGGTMDKEAMAEAYQIRAMGFASRRFWPIVCRDVTATLGGIDQVIEGFYFAAAYAGAIGGQPTYQSFTNFPFVGFKGVGGTSGYFKESQLDVIAAGGNTVIIQEGADTPLFARYAITSDLTSLETRTDSITKSLDFTSMFFRRCIRVFIGRFNITQGLLDSLGSVVHGLIEFLIENNVLNDASINNIIQDESNPDHLLMDLTLEFPMPCNLIQITLAV